ncbi:MAG: MBL fold metallo-hydrolase [Myxococcota bacterium]|jgi:glyoxylase-like metal-dependent hydrolase (beta-lactamase superfamily II)
MTKIENNVFNFSLPTPYPVGDVNTYFIDCRSPILIDTGVYSSMSLRVLRERFEENGLRMEDVKRILVTHHHYDHAGAARHLAQTLGATLYLLEGSERFARWSQESAGATLEYLVRCGMPREKVEKVIGLFSMGEKFTNNDATPGAVEYLRGGDLIDCGESSLEVVLTPGHSPDHVCYMDRSRGVMFSGDMLLPTITPNPVLYLDGADGWKRMPSLLNYIDSLERVRSCGARRCLPGHGSVIEDVPGLVEKNTGFIEERRQRLLDCHGDAPATPFGLVDAVFGGLNTMNRFLAVSEIVAYLDLLERRGEVTVDWEAPVIASCRTRRG